MPDQAFSTKQKKPCITQGTVIFFRGTTQISSASHCSLFWDNGFPAKNTCFFFAAQARQLKDVYKRISPASFSLQ
jgi:hypothetical protein